MPTLADELVLLAITEKGDVASGAWNRLDNGVAGAHLMELALPGRAALEDDSIAVADAAPTGSAPTDEVLEEIARSGKRRTPKEWIERLAGKFPHGRVVEDLRARLRGVLLEGRVPDARDAALASLVAATALVEEVFPEGEERARANERIEELGRGDAMRRALGEANEATLNATMVAVLIATSASVTASSTAAVISN